MASNSEAEFGGLYELSVSIIDSLGFTFDPNTKKVWASAFGAANSKQIMRDMYTSLCGKQAYTPEALQNPLYIVGWTNNKGPFNETTRRAFQYIISQGIRPVLGRWKELNDVSVVYCDLDEEEIMERMIHDDARIGKRKQQAAMKVYSNGEVEFVTVEAETKP